MNPTVDSPARHLVNQGALALGRGDPAAAERLFREAVATDPGNATAHANLGYVLSATGRHREGAGHSETAIGLEPDRSAPWAHLGMSRLALGEVGAGLSALATAVRLDPANHFAWDALGRAQLALGRPADAEQAWSSAVAAHPGDAGLRIALATALAAQDRTLEAARVLHEATERSPRSARAWTQLGVISLIRQDHGTAGEALLTALDLAPDDPAARFHLALLHLLAGATEQARDALRRLVAEDGDNAAEAVALLERIAGDGAVTGEQQDAVSHPGRTS
ncbi:tetratricopeptide repeat protein [Paractinoplanes maris]|uniref:tetratricopeptide repeat protein n=1 Tax=Paractinoplanes maris TaxID=1734446 RepID=UPI002020380F|nr:tetratricopeptide repeat protein [Actinoplanes maris]